MKKIDNFLIGHKVLLEVDSPINGKLTVIRDLAWGTYIKVQGITQSGGVVRDVWKSTLKKLKRQISDVKTCLILGLGGGSAAKLVGKFWPEVRITGVEIDPIMIKLGEKYMDLDKTKTKVIIEDAFEFCTSHWPASPIQGGSLSTVHYDLILIDLYIGDKMPKKFEQKRFFRLVSGLLNEGGVAIFNRLYFGDKRPGTMRFGDRLGKIFSEVTAISPEANIFFVCSK